MNATRKSFILTIGGLVILAVTAVSNASVPPLFLTLSVTTNDVVVETRINGTLETFLSGGAGGSLVSSVPINFHVDEGENVVEFSLSPTAANEGLSSTPRLLAILELHVKGEVVDTQLPGDGPIFVRELKDEEERALREGIPVVVSEKFVLDNDLFELIRVPLLDPTE